MSDQFGKDAANEQSLIVQNERLWDKNKKKQA